MVAALTPLHKLVFTWSGLTGIGRGFRGLIESVVCFKIPSLSSMKEEDISQEVVQQATDLFFSCGPLEDKQHGTLYVPISDLSKVQRSNSSVLANINVKDLETTFRLLDVNGDGKLTLEEFIDGFGQFLTDAQCTQTAKVIQKRRSLEEKAKNQEIIEEATRARQNSIVSLEILQELLSSTFYNTIQSILPKTAVEFDALVNQASKEIEEIQKSMQQLQHNLENQTENYHRSLEQAYSELDEKLAQEEEIHKLRVEQRSKQLNMEGRQNLAEKLEQLAEWRQKIDEVHVKMQNIQTEKDQNEKDIAFIRLENDELLESIDEIEQALDESKQTVEQLQTAAKLEHIKREKVDVSTCKQVQIECEELMRKLDSLRELNRQLRDERDEALHEHRTLEGMNRGSLLDEVNEVFGREEALLKKGAGKDHITCQSSTVENGTTKTHETGIGTLFSDDTDCEYDQPWINSMKTGKLSSDGLQVEYMAFNELQVHKQQIYEALEDDVFEPTEKPNKNLTTKRSSGSKETSTTAFKVIVLGHSGVGKTAIINQLCSLSRLTGKQQIGIISLFNNCFTVDGQQTTLQLWDMPGDERYYATNQPFWRRADGIIFVFDINSMSDFNKLNKQFVKFGRFLKQSKTPWLDTINLLLGNKNDLTETEANSLIKLAVPKSSAESFAKSLEASYFAVSAKSGQNLQPAMEDMIRRLRIAHQAKLNMSANEVKNNQTNEAPGCLSCCSM
ncbi:hypothetical protein PHET_01990 [Paragonimus heterotremus]|uniref:EF-hand domain-containing protein n=1 Tax=Paragonimus heterotremus TaxID=100268 RepID=A0A8J4TGE8_9TREM|nr:hypothetical protein PHET_01990 [Paragonimus heterotremus]